MTEKRKGWGMMEFSKKLLQLRRAKAVSQKTVAEACGISRQTYNGYETGLRYPRQRSTYEALANYFDVDVEFLFMDRLPIEIGREGGDEMARGAQARALAQELSCMFAGGELSEKDKAEVMRSLEQAYWISEQLQQEPHQRFRK